MSGKTAFPRLRSIEIEIRARAKGQFIMPYNILLMGASYGSLLASKLLFGGHIDPPGLPAGRGRA